MRIYKFPLANQTSPNEFTELLQVGARVLSAIMQNDTIVVYAMVNPNAEMERRKFHVFGTGWTIKEPKPEWVFVDTVKDGAFVWHVFAE